MWASGIILERRLYRTGVREKMNTKERWARSLKPGDMVEDCRFRIREIVEVIPEFSDDKLTNFVYRWCPLWVPDRVVESVLNSKPVAFVSSLLPPRYLDTSLILKDGSHCSAMHCCDPVNRNNNA